MTRQSTSMGGTTMATGGTTAARGSRATECTTTVDGEKAEMTRQSTEEPGRREEEQIAKRGGQRPMTRQSTGRTSSKERRATPDDSTINFDGRRRAVHDGDGRHDSGKGQQGDRMHNNFDGRLDDDKGQRGSGAAGQQAAQRRRRAGRMTRQSTDGGDGATIKREAAAAR